ncbi:aminotransferase class III-fold pyridoxal phosphate-dependent enzyme [Candidatus Pelagibacter ubique]|nr:aminotransferase class III-fold pyridoxal phosphate-dependent enzyme [Candidatus Pelagibacter ubique]
MYTFKKFRSKSIPKFISAENEYIYLSNYGKVLDFTSGWTGYASLGHNNKEILNSIKNQMKFYCHVDFNEFENPLVEKLSKKIIEFSKKKNKKIWYSGNSGSEALEAAMKLSYSAHLSDNKKNKTKFIHRSQSFHGASLHPLSISTFDIFDVFNKLKTKNIQINQNNIYTKYTQKYKMGIKKNESVEEHLARSLDDLEEKIIKNNPENICAMVGETQLGSLVGDVPAQKGYWKEVSKILKKYDIHLILDEIYCGMGRSGKLFNFEWDDINPDFVCVGKNTTSGCIPFSFVLTDEKFEKIILNKFGRVTLGHTFQGHSLGLVATNTVLEIIKRDRLLDRVKKEGNYIQKTIKDELKENHMFSNVRGRGFGVSVQHNVKNQNLFSKDLKSKLLEEHKILMNIKFHRTSLTPCYNMKKKNIDIALDKFIKTFKFLSNNAKRYY